MLENFTSEGRTRNEMKLLAFDSAEEIVNHILKKYFSDMDFETLEDLGGISDYRESKVARLRKIFSIPIWENEDKVTYILYKGDEQIIDNILELLNEKLIGEVDRDEQEDQGEKVKFISLQKVFENLNITHEYLMLENFFSEGRNYDELKLLALDTLEQIVNYILEEHMHHIDLDILDCNGGIIYYSETKNRFTIPVWEHEDKVEFILYKGNPKIIDNIVRLLPELLQEKEE